MVFKHHKAKLYVLGKAQALYQPKDTEGAEERVHNFQALYSQRRSILCSLSVLKQVRNSRQIWAASQLMAVVAELANNCFLREQNRPQHWVGCCPMGFRLLVTCSAPSLQVIWNKSFFLLLLLLPGHMFPDGSKLSVLRNSNKTHRYLLATEPLLYLFRKMNTSLSRRNCWLIWDTRTWYLPSFVCFYLTLKSTSAQ